MGTQYGRISTTSNPFAQPVGPDSPFSQFLDSGDTIGWLLSGGGLPPAVAPTQQAPEPEFVLRAAPEGFQFDPSSLPTRLTRDAAAAVGGALLGLTNQEEPYAGSGGEDLRRFYNETDEARAIETGVRIPVNLATQIAGAILTRGAWNAATGANRANAQNRKAVSDAVKAGNTAIAERIRQANGASMAAGAVYNYALARLPGNLGKGLKTKIATGAALGYPQDLADQALTQYATTGKVDASQLNYVPGLNTILGAGIPLAGHITVQGLPATKQAIQSGLSRAAEWVNREGRRAQPGFMRIGGSGGAEGQLQLPLGVAGLRRQAPAEGGYQTGLTNQRYLGEETGVMKPRLGVGKMQQDANAQVLDAYNAGEGRTVQASITYYERENPEWANALKQAQNQPEVTAMRSPEAAAADILQQKEEGSLWARLLRQRQEDPNYSHQREFVEAGLSKQPKDVPERVKNAGEDVKDIIEDSFGELYKIFTNLFKTFVETPAARPKVKGKIVRTPSKLKAPKEVKPRGERPFKLRVKTIKESEVEAKQVSQRKKRLETALAKENNKPKPNSERVRQLKLGLGRVEKREEQLKRLLAKALAEDPTKPRAPRVQRTTNDTPEQAVVRRFAKERLRAKAAIRRALEGRKKPIAKRPYQFTAAERDLMEQLAAQKKEGQTNRLRLRVKTIPEDTFQAVAAKQERAYNRAKANLDRLKNSGASAKQIRAAAKRVDREAARVQALQELGPDSSAEAGRQAMRLRDALDKDWEARRRKAVQALAQLEKTVEPQGRLPLQVKAQIQELTEDVLSTLGPEERREFNRLLAQKNRDKLFGELDKRVKASTKPRTPGKRESLKELYDRLSPQMSPAERQRYGELVTDIGRRRYLTRMTRQRSTPIARRKVLDRLMEAQGHDLLNDSHPEILNKILGEAELAYSMDKTAWRKLNQGIQQLTDPTLSPFERRLAMAELEKLISDQRNEPLLRKYFSFRAAGMLLRLGVQYKNVADQLVSWAGYRLSYPVRELSARLTPGTEYGITGANKPSFIARTSKAAKDFYNQHETGVMQELRLMAEDVKRGTNTSRSRGDISSGSGLRQTIFRNRMKNPAGSVLNFVDAVLGRGSQAIIGVSERLAYADAYRSQLTRDIELYRRVTGELPDPNSEVYQWMREEARRAGEQVTLTNNGAAVMLSRGGQQLITKAGDTVLGRNKSNSIRLGELFNPFTTVPANAMMRSLERVIPLFGAAQRWADAQVINAGAREGQRVVKNRLVGDIVVGQLTAALLAAGGLGGSAMYYAGYHGAVNIHKPDKNYAVEQTARAAGEPTNWVNYTAFQRYFTTRNPEDFKPQGGDVWFNPTGIGSVFDAAAALAAPGIADKAAGNGPQTSPNLAGVVTDFTKRAGLALTANDSFRGVNRLPDTLLKTRNPETGEFDIGTGLAVAAADTVGFTLPGADLLPRPLREPTTTAEAVLNRLPFGDRLLAERTDPEGNPVTVNALSNIFTQSTPDSYLGAMNTLRANTGRASHILGTLPRSISTTDPTGAPEKITLTGKQRTEIGPEVKKRYADLVAEAYAEPGFLELTDEQRVNVLTSIKNDVLRAYFVQFGKPISAPTVRKGKLNENDRGAMGAEAVYTGESYAGILQDYIDREIQRAEDEQDTAAERAARLREGGIDERGRL